MATDYRIVVEDKDGLWVLDHKDNLFSAVCAYLDAGAEYTSENVYLYEQEPETMQNRGYILLRSSKTDRSP